MQTFDGLVWDDTIGWYDPSIEVCWEDACKREAVEEKLVGVSNRAVDEDGFCWTVVRVCKKHK